MRTAAFFCSFTTKFERLYGLTNQVYLLMNPPCFKLCNPFVLQKKSYEN